MLCTIPQLDFHPACGSMQDWYVAQTIPGQETVACANLISASFETFLPKCTKTRTHARRVDTIVKPLFPTYLFVAFDLAKDPWRWINSVRGVQRILTSNSDKPLPLQSGVVEEIKARCEAEGGAINLETRAIGLPILKPREGVIVTEGAFTGMRGIVSQSDEQRVFVLLAMFKGTVRMQIPRAHLVAS